MLHPHNVYSLLLFSLSRAIRLHMLVNPTGKPHAFRGVDWVVELMNLFTKVVIALRSTMKLNVHVYASGYLRWRRVKLHR